MANNNIWDIHMSNPKYNNTGESRKIQYTNFVNDVILETVKNKGIDHYSDQNSQDTLAALIKYGRFTDKTPEFTEIFNALLIENIRTGRFVQLFDISRSPMYNFNFDNYTREISTEIISAFDAYLTSANNFMRLAYNSGVLAFYANILSHYNYKDYIRQDYIELYKNNSINKLYGNNTIRYIFNWFYLTDDIHNDLDESIISGIVSAGKINDYLMEMNKLQRCGRGYNLTMVDGYHKFNYKFDVMARLNRHISYEYHLGIII